MDDTGSTDIDKIFPSDNVDVDNNTAAADTSIDNDETSPLLPDSKPSGSSTNYSSYTSTSIPRKYSFKPQSKQRHWKNLIGLSAGFMFTFTAYSSLQNLQSSLNPDAGLGLASLSVIYGCLAISCLLAPLPIKIFGTKWTVVIGLTCFSLFAAVNFYPEFYTMIPVSAIIGLAAGPLWAAEGTYLTTLAISLADITNNVPETIINQFNGNFFMFYQASQIWGNLLSSLIFSTNSTREAALNQSDLWKCGRNGTGQEGGNYADPGKEKTNLLLSLYLVIGLLGGITAAIFMDKIRTNKFKKLSEETGDLVGHVLEVFRLMKTPYIALLIPLMIYSGFEQAYLFGDFTKSFVSCTIGIRRVGYVMIVFGVTDAISSFLIGRVEVVIGRKVIFTAGGVMNLFIIVWMLLWRPTADVNQGYQLYLMAVGWGFADAVWQTQISSILGVLMPQSQEAAFGNFRFWQAIGFLVSFGVSTANSVLVLYKLYALLGLLIVSMACYYIVECVIRREGM